LEQVLQFLLQVDGCIGGERVELNPHIHITGFRGFIPCGGAEQADALQLVTLSPFALVGTQQGQQLVGAEPRAWAEYFMCPGRIGTALARSGSRPPTAHGSAPRF
jgi:hypothetical protein